MKITMKMTITMSLLKLKEHLKFEETRMFLAGCLSSQLWSMEVAAEQFMIRIKSTKTHLKFQPGGKNFLSIESKIYSTFMAIISSNTYRWRRWWIQSKICLTLISSQVWTRFIYLIDWWRWSIKSNIYHTLLSSKVLMRFIYLINQKPITTDPNVGWDSCFSSIDQFLNRTKS